MKKQSIAVFYGFGTCLRYLQDVRAGYGIEGDGRLLANIAKFNNLLKHLDLVVTQRVANQQLSDTETQLKTAAPGTKVSETLAAEIKQKIQTIRTTLEAELRGIYAYTPTPKRLDTEKLLGDIGALFAPDVFNQLPEIARYDFTEAGKCIVFEVPTAAAFHLVRGTEAVLRFYYESLISHNRVSPMWGPIVQDLRKRTKTKQYGVLNNQLDNVRASFRNPTQHPEAIYDIHEVQDLWGVCVDVVNRMLKILKDHGKA